MQTERNRRTTPKCMLEKAVGKNLSVCMLPALHKVQIMEHLLSCPASELNRYQTGEWPNFIYECAHMLIDGRMLEYMQCLAICRQMSKEEGENALDAK